ncbi:MAG: hypothetical protein WC525_10130 [Candidatus Thermoplasmatota archaeon]
MQNTQKSPVKDLRKVLKNWQRIKDEIRDTECGGETWDFLAENTPPDTMTAQHALWRGCEQIIKLCHEINDQIDLPYPHPIPSTPIQGAKRDIGKPIATNKFYPEWVKLHDNKVTDTVLDEVIQFCRDEMEAYTRLGKGNSPEYAQYCHVWNKCEDIRWSRKNEK